MFVPLAQVSFVHLDDEIHIDNLQPDEMLVTADELPEAPNNDHYRS